MPSEHNGKDIFTCRQCGDCCRGYGGTYVTPEDIAAIAAYLGTDPAHFVSDYCQMSGSRPVLAQGKDGYCTFARDRICTIHPVKPRMCRAWPYLESVMVDVGNWRAMAGSCPGIQTDVPDAVILERVREEIRRRQADRQRTARRDRATASQQNDRSV